MYDQSDKLKQARQFADTAYTAVVDVITKESMEKLTEARSLAATKGIVQSGAMTRRSAQIYGKRAQQILQARLDAILEGCELHSVTLDEVLALDIVNEILTLKESLLSDTAFAAPVDMGPMRPEQFVQLVWAECQVSHASIEVQIERWRMRSKKDQSSVTNIYHVHGHNPRWNVDSTDRSVNVVVTSNEQVFAKLRQEVASAVPEGDEQKDILEKLSLLEKAQNTPAFGKRYSEFIGVAANHMTLIGPFIPALTEMLHKIL